MTCRQSTLRILVAVVAGALLVASALAAQQYSPDLLKGMKYRLIGPYRGGRALTAVGVVSEPNTYYFGAVAGGVWKTTNGGMSWTPLFDKESVASIGSVAVSESDPNVIYVGTGEACIRGNISHGDGVYKSTDAGKTWTNVGLRDTRNIGRVLVHPRNPDNAYVAALGHAYGQNSERGVFRTLDGGKTWEKVLYKDEKTGAIDIALDRSNPRILFAALWEAGRTPWSLTSGGPGSGLYKSSDGGATWKQITGNGWPEGTLGKIGVSISGGNPNRIYVMLEALEEAGGVYRSDDGGEHWRQMTSDHRLRHRPWYYTHITADTKDPETVYVLCVGLYRSSDGGRTWTPMRAMHGDHHGLWVDPNNPKRMIGANDGGATITVDGGESWSRQDNQPTAQFYHVTTDNQFPYNVYGSQQDNSNVKIASRSDWGQITVRDWYPVGGGEAGYIAPHPTDPNIVYAGEYFGILTRFDRRTNQAHNISVWPDDTDGYAAKDVKYRFNWTEPIHVSRHDPSVVYYAGNILFQSTDEGMSWTPISPDLTRNDKSKQQFSGGLITGENISVEYYDVIFSFAESPRQKDLLWAGTDDGLVHLTRDGGKSWANVTPKEMPEWSMVSIVDASPHDAGSAYIAVDRHKLDDFRPYIYKTQDYGKSWKKIVSGIREDTFVRAVREDPKRQGLLYAGTETGVFVSFDDGAHWQALQLNLPTAPIHDLVVKDDDLVVATHGRSFWILDDLSPLRQMSDAVAKEDAHLFTPAPALRWRGGSSARPVFAGENPPDGAILYYTLKEKPKEEMTLEILDAKGAVVRKYTSTKKVVEGRPLPERPGQDADADPNQLSAEPGLTRWVWNLRYELPEFVPNAIFDMGPPSGPLALPGRYQVRLTVAGKSTTAPLEVKLDPRVTTPPADLEKQFQLLTKVRALVEQQHGAVLEIRNLRAQLQALRKRLAGNAGAKEVINAADEIDKKMSAVEEELIEVKAKSSQDMCNYPTKLNGKLGWLDQVIDSADRAPTKQAYEFTEVMRAQLEAQLAAWKEIVRLDVAALNERMQREQIPALTISAASK
ncbi:MAG: VPS10 domain-containing protein [Candidatus Acidiferrales bacterium]